MKRRASMAWLALVLAGTLAGAQGESTKALQIYVVDTKEEGI
jgi:hypothetical protein